MDSFEMPRIVGIEGPQMSMSMIPVWPNRIPRRKRIYIFAFTSSERLIGDISGVVDSRASSRAAHARAVGDSGARVVDLFGAGWPRRSVPNGGIETGGPTGRSRYRFFDGCAGVRSSQIFRECDWCAEWHGYVRRGVLTKASTEHGTRPGILNEPRRGGQV